MINIESLNKSYSGNFLFKDVSFQLNRRERVGLVGRNGHGKTTLFRMLTKQEQPDSGTIIVPKNYRIGYVAQKILFSKNTVLEEAVLGLPDQSADQHWKAEKILAGLGFSNNDFNKSPMEFSGGLQVRLNLAKVMVSEPDMLLLDEPTNYLDITSIRWISNYLLNWPGELFLITHDRMFMDKVVTHIVGIHRKKIRKIKGNTIQYYNQIKQDEEIYEKTRLNEDRKKKDIELFITKFRAKARLANMVQSRVKTLEKQENKEKLSSIKALNFAFNYLPCNRKFLLEVRNISFSYENKDQIIKNFNISIGKNDKICIIGKNGKGKTTLIKLVAENLVPEKGEIKYLPGVERSFFEQTNIESLDKNKTVLEEILYTHENIDLQKARNVCGLMMFGGDSALKKISVLSGGEKSRVMLGKILVKPINILLLDEPTNHLDMESCDALLSALIKFNGSVVMVTHNEMFLNKLATKLIVFQNDEVFVFEGSYKMFLEKIGWEDEGELKKNILKPINSDNEFEIVNKKELRRQRSKIISQKSIELRPFKIEIEKNETQIDMLENKINLLSDKMQDASMKQDGALIAKISQEIHNCQEKIDICFDRLEDQTEKYDAINIKFDKKIIEIDDKTNKT